MLVCYDGEYCSSSNLHHGSGQLASAIALDWQMQTPWDSGLYNSVKRMSVVKEGITPVMFLLLLRLAMRFVDLLIHYSCASKL